MAHLECASFLQGQVTHIVDPSDFWMRVGTEDNFKAFEDFEGQLNAYCRQQRVGTTESVEEYSVILVNCVNKSGKIGSQWKRATVHRINRQKDAYDVFYLDYGNTENVAAKRICEVVTSFIQQFPSQCHKYALAGIKPIASSYTNRGVKVFTKLATAGQLQVLILSFDSPTMCYRAALYPSVGSQRSLTHELLDQGIGLETEETVPEFAEYFRQNYVYGYSSRDNDQNECSSSVDPRMGLASGLPPERHHVLMPLGHQNGGMFEGDGDRASVHHQLQIVEHSRNNQSTKCNPERRKSISPETVVVPSFNISLLQQQSMSSAAEFQKEAEAAIQAERKARLQQDIIACHRDLDFQGIQGYTSGDKWGPPQVERRASGGSDSDVYDRISKQIRLAASDEERNDGNQDGSLLQNAGLISSQDIGGGEASASHNTSLQDGTDSPVPLQADVQNELGRHAEIPLPIRQNRGSPTSADFDSNAPHFVTEDEEYNLKKTFCNILFEIKHGEDLEMVQAQFLSITSVDAGQNEEVMGVLLQLLLDEGVKNPDLTDAAVSILNAYASALDDSLFHASLRRCCEKYVKLPVGKMSPLHVNFASLLTKLLQIAAVWPPQLQTAVKDFTLHSLEKWIIFNKKGTQTGILPQRLESMYVDCLEMLVPQTIGVLLEADEERVHFVYCEIKCKVLESDVDYSIRSRLLDLLYFFRFSPTEEECEKSMTRAAGKCLQVAQSTQTVTDAGLEHEEVAPTPRSAMMGKNKANQTERTASRSSESGRKKTVKTANTQTEIYDWGKARWDMPVLGEVGVQTNLLPAASRDSVSSSGTGMEHISDVTGPTPGRARRRRALMQHLHGHPDKGDAESEKASITTHVSISSSTSPSPSPLLHSYSTSGSSVDEGMEGYSVDGELPSQSAAASHLPSRSSPERPENREEISDDPGQTAASQEETVYEAEQGLSKCDFDSDFPAFAVGRAADINVRCFTPLLLTQLSLQSIATGILGWSADEVQDKLAKTDQEEEEHTEGRESATPVPSPENRASSHPPDRTEHGISCVSGRGFISDAGCVKSSSPDKCGTCYQADKNGSRVLKDGSGDHLVPDDWEMQYCPESDSVGPAGDAPASAEETSSSSIYADCRQDPDSSTGDDAEGWSMKEPPDPALFFNTDPQDSTPACHYQSTSYGFEIDSDDSWDSFDEAEYNPDLFLAVKPDSGRDVQPADDKTHQDTVISGQTSPWAQGEEPEQASTFKQIGVSLLRGNTRGNFSQREKTPEVSASDLGCLPGESIRTMPKSTSHTRNANRNPSIKAMPDESFPDSVVGYERRDLSGSSSPKRERASPVKKNTKGGRVKFRPFTAQHKQVTAPEAAPWPWVPTAKCTNCGQEGHMRYDCTNKATSSFFYD